MHRVYPSTYEWLKKNAHPSNEWKCDFFSNEIDTHLHCLAVGGCKNPPNNHNLILEKWWLADKLDRKKS